MMTASGSESSRAKAQEVSSGGAKVPCGASSLADRRGLMRWPILRRRGGRCAVVPAEQAFPTVTHLRADPLSSPYAAGRSLELDARLEDAAGRLQLRDRDS